MADNICLVTGVAGFIGSQLAERLVRDGHVVIGLDCFTDYYERAQKVDNLRNLVRHDRFELVEGDLVDLDLAAVLRGDLPSSGPRHSDGSGRAVQYVFHLAAQAGVRASWGRSFETYLHHNVLATQLLLEAARAVPVQKFVYASSSSVYGDAEAYPTSEDLAPRPVSPYGVTKLAAEHLAWLYWRNHGVPVVGLRYFTVYGPRQRPDMAFHRFIRSILTGGEIVVYGDGEQTRDFTYVDDAVEGTVRAAFSDVAGQVLNIGGGSRTSVNTLIRLLEEIVGKTARVRYGPPGQGDVRHTSADTRRARDLIGYAPRTPLVQGLRQETAWLQSRLREPAQVVTSGRA